MTRSRSFWGWGYEDGFPDDDARKDLALRIQPIVGRVPELQPLPSAARLSVPQPRFTPPVELRGLGTTDPRDRAQHTYGRGYRDLVRGFRGDFSPAPDWVFYPTEESHLVALFRFCEAESVALVPYGGGTNVVGGVEHHARAGGRTRGTACVDLSRMDKVLEIDTASRAARIQAGATGPRIAQQLAPQGLWLRHYPQSFELSTLGGWIATRAGGHYATLYTHIDDLVQALRVLTPAGVIETRRVPASGAGPAPERLFLGSEGAFGIVHPRPGCGFSRRRPGARARASASAASATRVSACPRPLAVRSLSGELPSPRRGRRRCCIAFRAMERAVLLLAFESADHPVEPWMERALSIATDLGGNCDEERRTLPSRRISSTRWKPDFRALAAPAALPVLPASELPRRRSRHADESSWRRSFFEAPYIPEDRARLTLGVVCDTLRNSLYLGALSRASQRRHGAPSKPP